MSEEQSILDELQTLMSAEHSKALLHWNIYYGPNLSVEMV